MYIEFPELDKHIPIRIFKDQGTVSVIPHIHTEIEIIYILKGDVSIGTNEGLFHLDENDIYIVYSGQPHYFMTASNNSDRLVLQMDLSFFEDTQFSSLMEYSLPNLFLEGESHSMQWDTLLKESIKRILLEIYNISHTTSKGRHFAIFGKLFELLSEFQNQLPQRKDESNNSNSIEVKSASINKVSKAIKYIEENFEKNITLDNVAEHVGYSPQYFSRIFKQTMGTTFTNFITEYRIMKAKYFLVSQFLPMIEISEMSGFNSVKTFHHTFKKVTGISPLQYRKENI